tara:strand:- start:620 stop:883 length:264 start_codon:yes stop_codon:yes gene_type:complete
MNILKVLLSVLLIGSLCSCAKVQKFKSLGNPHVIKQYSGGVLVNEWVSKGKVLNEENTDGYYFFTKENRYIEASGTLVIERLKEGEK